MRTAVCPRCRPWAIAVRHPDGRRTGYKPIQEYVGFLVTKSYAGWKRPPATCPNCGATLEIRDRVG